MSFRILRLLKFLRLLNKTCIELNSFKIAFFWKWEIVINNNYDKLMKTPILVVDKELDMIGCSLIIVLRDILMCSIFAPTCMQGLYINCLEINLFYVSCR